MSKPIKVRAIDRGYYDTLRNEGDTFFIADEQAFSKKWMEDVDGVIEDDEPVDAGQKLIDAKAADKAAKAEKAAAEKAAAEKAAAETQANTRSRRRRGTNPQ